MNHRATFAQIDLAALRHNFGLVRRYAPTQKIMPVIKADAYGHGAVEVAAALTQADALAVAIIDEAVALRESGIRLPITVLQGVSNQEQTVLAQQLGLDLVVQQPEQIELLERAQSNRPLLVWLKIDTGMHRLGISANNVLSCYQRLQASPNVAEVRLMSHLACADDPGNPMTDEQSRAFDRILSGVSGSRSLANSAAIMAWPQTHHEWVRPGIMLYGAAPLLDWRGCASELQAVMTLRSTIIAIKDVGENEGVGYGANWVSDKPSRIAIVGIGYGDGYPRRLGNGTPVLVKDQLATLVGRVSMDSIAVDISSLPEIQLGDPVTLWGAGLPVEDIAERAQTISYELLCQITSRVPRRYRK